ncbi:hypothetical protein PYCC9005_000208 [Savitreella phatthalungensis]
MKHIFLSFCWLAVTWLFGICSANTEKTIFTAPPASFTAAGEDNHKGRNGYNISNLTRISGASHGSGFATFRDAIVFPLPIDGASHTRWYLLDELSSGRKYEVRVCWPASMPTIFTLTTVTAPVKEYKVDHPTSRVILRLDAFPELVPCKDLVEDVRVDFELVLDPLLFGGLPRSIVWTVLLVVVSAAFALRVVQPILITIIHRTIYGRRQKIVRIKTH